MPQSKPGTIYERFGITAMADEGIRPGGFKLTERALEFCRFGRQSPVLDVGCGNGATVHLLRTVHDLWAVGMDASSVLAGEARKRGASFPLVIGTAGRLPFSDTAFRGVFLECTLSLTSNHREVLGECHRVIQTGGKLVITDVHVRNPDGLAGLANQPPTSCLRGAQEPNVVRNQVRAAGFEIELWEDHSDLLKEFVMRIVWTMGSMNAFWGLGGDRVADAGAMEEAVRHSRPGYHLLIGHKTAANGRCHRGPLPPHGEKTNR
jgi:arsenite methyltransferase